MRLSSVAQHLGVARQRKFEKIRLGVRASWFKDEIGYILVVIWRGTDNHPFELGLYPIFLYFQTKPGVSRNFLWDYPPTVGYAFLANESQSEPWMRAVPCHSHGCSCSTVISCHGDIFTYSAATFPYVQCSTVDLYIFVHILGDGYRFINTSAWWKLFCSIQSVRTRQYLSLRVNVMFPRAISHGLRGGFYLLYKPFKIKLLWKITNVIRCPGPKWQLPK